MTTRQIAMVAVLVAAGAAVGLRVTVASQAPTPGTPTPEELRASMGANRESALVPLPAVNTATSQGWPLNNLDAKNSRHSALTQITSQNVRTLAVRWLHHTRNAGSTPIVVNGVMYVSSPDSVFALDAATGRLVWSNTNVGAARGVAYGDGVIYVAKGAQVTALDARTGLLVPSFGDGGVSNALVEALKAKFPQMGKPTDWGYSINMVPQYASGVLIVGTALSENHIPGGVILAIDGKSGRALWRFLGVPQGPDDEGWAIAKDTWVGGARHGGGLWATPAIDAESGTVHLTIANPSPDQDGSARKGINLFSNAFVALDLRTGRLKWYFQQVHHDLWDYDAGQQPILFDLRVGGRLAKATAAGNKNGFVYVLDRETGKPFNPIVETPVPTESDTLGEEVWPTQPIPHTAKGKPMTPTAPQSVDRPLFPMFEKYPKVPFYTPPRRDGAVHAPREAVHYGGNAFNPQTGLLYVAGKDLPIMMTVVPTGNTLKNGQFSTAGRRDSAAPEKGSVSAYDPATNELVWRTAVNGGPSAGVFSTAGNLVFVGDRQGMFAAMDAKTGKSLWSFYTGGAIRGGQITYQVNGTQYVTVPSGGDLIVTFALPGR
ncbi:MAG: PQQ-binding-like beta-propeller repeat protein [Vicinamibacterales bacterium]|nr:PQQ-binding-like beta-propeller repeat protein [Vicinamibacterales bacterium]